MWFFELFLGFCHNLDLNSISRLWCSMIWFSSVLTIFGWRIQFDLNLGSYWLWFQFDLNSISFCWLDFYLIWVQLIIPDEQPCFDLTQMSTLISKLGLFSSLSLLFAWRAVCVELCVVEFISCSPWNN